MKVVGIPCSLEEDGQTCREKECKKKKTNEALLETPED